MDTTAGLASDLLGYSYATLGNQLDRLQLELAAECRSSLHELPPGFLFHLTKVPVQLAAAHAPEFTV